MKTKSFFVGMVICFLSLVLVPGLAQAGMWVGLQGGANGTASTDLNIGNWLPPHYTSEFKDVKRDWAALGGIIIGYDFVKEGFLGYNYPDWMKYFSFCTDFTYNRAESPNQMVDIHETSGAGWYTFQDFMHMEMSLSCWSFLFKARYGFFPDSEVPFGRLQPYIMVGPGILFSSVRGSFYNFRPFTASSVDVALVTEAGIRWMALKNVSLDAGFRFRWAEPNYSASINGYPANDIKTNLYLFTAMFRVSYHF